MIRSLKQREIKFESRIKLNHDMYKQLHMLIVQKYQFS